VGAGQSYALAGRAAVHVLPTHSKQRLEQHARGGRYRRPPRGVGAAAQACGARRAVACWTPAHAMNVSQQRMQAHAHAARVARQSMRVLHMSLRGRRAGKRGRPRQQGGSARSAERGPRTLYSASAAFPSVQATCMCDEFAETAQVGADLARA